ncbi:SGNH/GDSL hydrolase family protein [Pedobacter ginsengisoli]|uniref:SGNH/GDSL hydrolase family protein n=1 Tax=Pedobacter ginsengisoli TaxID=363852 RepID=UPI00254FCA87|nr:SGNH/GDSL hydrolase family protein [Pedobacter ginsengisoli]
MNRNTNTNDTTLNVNKEKGKLSYLALGDSYTIGESVETALNFPNQLVAQLSGNGLAVAAPRIIARTGWTTSELTSAIGSSGVAGKFNFVTLLIGVNNQYRGESLEAYRKEFKQLLQTAIDFANNDKAHVFVISIPDWSVTPFAQTSDRDQAAISTEINAFNAVNRQETLALGITYIDITPASRMAATDTTLVASDGLHPSAKMYKDWAVNTAAAILDAFK